MADTISSGRPMRRAGTICSQRPISFGLMDAISSVSIGPGTTALTVTPRGPTSRASALGHAEQSDLGRRVVGLARQAVPAAHGGHEDEAAPAVGGHVGQRGVGDVERAGEVDVKDGGEVLVGHAARQAVVHQGGVGHDDVERGVGGTGPGEHGVDAGRGRRRRIAPEVTPSAG